MSQRHVSQQTDRQTDRSFYYRHHLTYTNETETETEIEDWVMMNFMYTYTKTIKEADTHKLERPSGERRRRN